MPNTIPPPPACPSHPMRNTHTHTRCSAFAPPRRVYFKMSPQIPRANPTRTGGGGDDDEKIDSTTQCAAVVVLPRLLLPSMMIDPPSLRRNRNHRQQCEEKQNEILMCWHTHTHTVCMIRISTLAELSTEHSASVRRSSVRRLCECYLVRAAPGWCTRVHPDSHRIRLARGACRKGEQTFSIYVLCN